MLSCLRFSSGIYSSIFSHLFALVLLNKKLSGGIRFCIGYLMLNTISKKDQYLILFIQELFTLLKAAKYFTKLHLWQAFYQIKILKNSEKLTIFFIRFAAFKYLVMPFNLFNKQVFGQYLINNTLFYFFYHFVQASIDYIFINSKMLKDHLSYVWSILKHLHKARI